MSKETKTNAMRILDKNKIQYETITYECKEFIDGIHAAKVSGISASVDLKKAAKVVGEKSIEMIHTKDIMTITGYVRM